MSIAVLSLLALVAAIVVASLRSDLNAGVLALALAYAIGVGLAGLSATDIAAYLPAPLILTLIGIALLFEMAHQNGTLERLAQYAMRAVNGHPARLPLIFFLLAFGLSALGPGNIAATALLAPVGMTVAVNAGVRPLLMAIMICTGANAGAFSPVALTGSINIGLMSQIGVNDPATAQIIFLAVAALQSLSALAAYIVFSGYRVTQARAVNGVVARSPAEPLSARHRATVLAMLALVVAVIVFHVPTGVGALVLAGVLALLKVGDSETSLKALPWSIIALVGGISVLIGLIEKTGGLDLATSLIAAVASPQIVNALLALVTGLASIYSSSSGVIMPAFVPLIPGLIQKMGSGNLVEMIIAVDVCSHMVDVSPLSTLRALCLAALPGSADERSLFRGLLLWGVLMAGVGAMLAFVFLDLL
ncbi:MAG: SLC13 family permease [Anaerolineales bacterium]